MGSVLDTNVISELMKVMPAANLVQWIDSRDPTELFITSITIAEISYGIAVLPTGKRRLQLDQAFKTVISEAFANRILMFDDTAAHIYGELMAHRKQLGRPFSVLDGQIAAIALLHKCSIITRNTNDFLDCGLDVINPF